MKKAALPSLVLALLVPAMAALAQTKMDDMKGMDMAKKPEARVAAGCLLGNREAQTSPAAAVTRASQTRREGLVNMASSP